MIFGINPLAIIVCFFMASTAIKGPASLAFSYNVYITLMLTIKCRHLPYFVY